MCTVRQLVAQYVDENNDSSPWMTGRPHALKAVRRALGPSDYKAREGVNSGGANAVYWLEIVATRPDGCIVVANITEGAKREVESIQATIEPDLVYPLLRGRDVGRWNATPQASILITHRPGMGLKAIPESEMAVKLPKTYSYLRRFEHALRVRSAFRRYFRENDPFYSMFNVGDYTLAPHKVVWREQASLLTAAVVSGEPHAIAPDHKLMMVAFDAEFPAHYLCAVLNSSPAQFVVLSYAVNIQMGPHILENVRVPRFEPDNPVHQRLAQLSRAAHQEVLADNAGRVREIELEISELSGRLWGLTAEELKEIQRSLEELA